MPFFRGERYQPGVGIASHVDAHGAFEEGIAAVSLGSGIAVWPKHEAFHFDIY